MPRSLGSWARRVEGGLVAEPADERELIEVVHVLADRGVALHRDIALSRARLTKLGVIHAKSMSLRVGAGVVLKDLEAHLQPHGLTIGPLSPAAMSMQLGEFLEGPYAGLRSIPGGRLEPLCTALVAILPDGRRFETSNAPRSAAGPDLGALVLGGSGRVALVTEATVRCFAYPERDLRLGWSFPTPQAFVTGIQRSIAEGFWPWRVHADSHQGKVIAEVRWAALVGSVERDRELLARCVESVGGGPSAEAEKPGPIDHEREATWDSVRLSLEQGTAVQLFRLSLATVVARGDVDGLRLNEEKPWSPLSEQLVAVDVRKTFGGAP